MSTDKKTCGVALWGCHAYHQSQIFMWVSFCGTLPSCKLWFNSDEIWHLHINMFPHMTAAVKLFNPQCWAVLKWHNQLTSNSRISPDDSCFSDVWQEPMKSWLENAQVKLVTEHYNRHTRHSHGGCCCKSCLCVNPLKPTVAIWVQLYSILCQTGLSRHL